MRVGASHLTYCTNVHPGESWPDVRRNLEEQVLAVRSELGVREPFGLGVWLSHAAGRALEDERTLRELQAFLAQHALYVFTLNGFPFGAFHGTRVKERVYLPDWRDPARREHSHRLARVLAQLLPDGVSGSISTVPGAFKPALDRDDDAQRIADQLLVHVAELHALEASSGRRITLALEPEPCCMLETIAETVAFFTRYVHSEAAARVVSEHAGVTRSEAERLIRRHLGVCLDACHAAVEYEEPRGVLHALRAAEIPIAKLQISAGLRIPAVDAAACEALESFAEDVYLHQVVEQRSGRELMRYVDLPDALAARRAELAAQSVATAELPEWRVHFHVPVFESRLGAFASTQDFLRALLAEHAAHPISAHLEIETYTFGVLPPALRAASLPQALARELRFVLDALGQAVPGTQA